MDCRKVDFCCDKKRAGPEVFWTLSDCRKSCFYNEDRKTSLPKCGGVVGQCLRECMPGEESTYYNYDERKKKCVSFKGCCPFTDNVFKDRSSCERICKHNMTGPRSKTESENSKESKESTKDRSSEE